MYAYIYIYTDIHRCTHFTCSSSPTARSHCGADGAARALSNSSAQRSPKPGADPPALLCDSDQKINRPHARAHDSRTNHSHEHRASNGATPSILPRGFQRSEQQQRPELPEAHLHYCATRVKRSTGHTHTHRQRIAPPTPTHTRQEQQPKPPNEHLPQTLNNACGVNPRRRPT